jgi:ribosomal protein L31E
LETGVPGVNVEIMSIIWERPCYDVKARIAIGQTYFEQDGEKIYLPCASVHVRMKNRKRFKRLNPTVEQVAVFSQKLFKAEDVLDTFGLRL